MTPPRTARRSQRPPAANERGAVLVWFALFLLVILAFTALGTDVAKLMVTHTQLQNAADAAALAGASAVDAHSGAIVPSTAVARARSVAALDKAYVEDPQPVELDPSDVEFLGTDEVRVTVRRTGAQSMITQFMQVIGIPSVGLTASATAKVDTTHTASCGLVPLAVSPPVPDGLFHPGVVYTLKDAGGNGKSGNYGAVDFPPCDKGTCSGGGHGAATWQCLLGSGYCCDLAVGTTLLTEPGSMAGPFRKGIDDRFFADTDTQEGITYDQYVGNGQRVLFVPITTTLSSGRASVVVTGFGAFFVRSLPEHTGGDLQGEYVYAVMPGSGDGGNGSALSVRLIH